jgi:hypothetical protein
LELSNKPVNRLKNLITPSQEPKFAPRIDVRGKKEKRCIDALPMLFGAIHEIYLDRCCTALDLGLRAF